MQTKSKNTIVESIKLFMADKPALYKRFENFEVDDSDLTIYSAFTGSKHELPTRSRYSK
ncbi:MAG: hypothetical protein U0R17_04370 [Acidimicrobiia bacterium]